MLERAQARTLPVLNRAVDITPAAPACCGACRTCMTTNVFAAAGLAIAASSGFVARVARRFSRHP